MATQEVNDLLVRVDATTELLRRELRKAERTTGASVKKIEDKTRRIDRRFDNMGKAASKLRGLFLAAFGAASVRALNQFAQQQVTVADRIGKAAVVAGVTTDQIQELRAAFSELAGTQDREVDESLRRFNRRLGEARRGNQAYLKTYRQLNIELKDSNGFRSTSAILEDTINQLAGYRNEAVRASLASVLFGEDAGPKLAAAMSRGAGAIADVRKQLREDGGLIPDKAIKDAEDLTDRMEQINRVISAEQAKVVLENAEALEELAVAMGKIKTVALSGAGALATFFNQASRMLFPGGAQGDLQEMQGRIQQIDKLMRLPAIFGGPANEEARNKLLAERLRLMQQIAALRKTGKVEAEARAANGLPPKTSASSTSTPIERQLQLPPQGPPSQMLDVNRAKLSEVEAFLQSTRTEVEQIESQIARVKDLASGGFFSAAGVDDKQILERLNAQLDEVKNKTVETSNQIATVIATNVGGAFDQLFTSGELRSEEFGKAVLRDLLKITTQLFIMKPIIESIFGAGGGKGQIGQAVFRAFGFNTGGSFQVGGRPGPDANFVPLKLTKGEQVDITPAGKSSSKGAININTTINAQGAQQGAAEQLRAELDLRDRQIIREVQSLRSRGRL